MKLFIRSSKDIEPLVPTTMHSCLIYPHNSPLILFLKVKISQYKCQPGATVSCSKPGLYISNAASITLLLKISGDCKVGTRDSYVEGKL